MNRERDDHPTLEDVETLDALVGAVPLRAWKRLRPLVLTAVTAESSGSEIIPSRLRAELNDHLSTLQYMEQFPELNGDPMQAIRGWAWWLDRVLQGDY